MVTIFMHDNTWWDIEEEKNPNIIPSIKSQEFFKAVWFAFLWRPSNEDTYVTRVIRTARIESITINRDIQMEIK